MNTYNFGNYEIEFKKHRSILSRKGKMIDVIAECPRDETIQYFENFVRSYRFNKVFYFIKMIKNKITELVSRISRISIISIISLLRKGL